MENECLERITKVEERAKQNTYRINKLEAVVDEIHTLSKTMVKLVEIVRCTNDTVDSLGEKMERMDCRVDEMERIPAEDMKKYKNTAVTAIISTLAGAIASGLIFLIAQNI